MRLARLLRPHSQIPLGSALKSSYPHIGSTAIIFAGKRKELSVHVTSMKKSFSSFPEQSSIFLAIIEDYSN